MVSFLLKWEKRDFFKKALGTFISRLQSLTNCKVSEKSNEGNLRKRVTNGRTNGQTDRRGLNSRFLRILRRSNNMATFRKI